MILGELYLEKTFLGWHENRYFSFHKIDHFFDRSAHCQKDKLVGRSSDKSHWPICHVKLFFFFVFKASIVLKLSRSIEVHERKQTWSLQLSVRMGKRPKFR